jgi:hypothetical protein
LRQIEMEKQVKIRFGEEGLTLQQQSICFLK